MTSRLLLILCAAGLSFGQNATISSADLLGRFESSATVITTPATGAFAWCCSTNRVIQGDGSGVWTARAVETRTDDGKGPTVAQVDASAKRIAAAKLPTSHYRELAVSFGLNPSPITDEADIVSAISELGLHVYDWNRVDGYLYRQALRHGANARWVWKPLREVDLKSSKESLWTDQSNVGYIYGKQYAHAIPENVLEHASALLEKAPKAIFLVSDYEVIRPDPFLAVTTERLLAAGKIWIIERWDEPGFREEPAREDVVTAKVAR